MFYFHVYSDVCVYLTTPPYTELSSLAAILVITQKSSEIKKSPGNYIRNYVSIGPAAIDTERNT